MPKNVLLCSIDAPFIGGAGTNAYNLIKLLRSHLKYNVVGLFIYTNTLLLKDPHNIGDIIKFNPNRDDIEKIRTDIVKALGTEPDVMIVKNYIPVFIVKKMFPRVKLVFLPSGSSLYGHYCTINKQITVTELIDKFLSDEVQISDIISHNGRWPCYPQGCQTGCDCEMRALSLADKIIPNSYITELLYRAMYDNNKLKGLNLGTKITQHIYTSALYDTNYISKNIKLIEFNKRGYDVTFACFNWKRKLKNISLVEQIINHDSMKNLHIMVIGELSNLLKPRFLNTTIVGCIDNKKFLECLANSKVVLCPSYYDSFPNVVTEANLCGCNVVISRNIGQSIIVQEHSLVDNFYDVTEWITKILNASKKKYNTYNIDQMSILKEFDEVLRL